MWRRIFGPHLTESDRELNASFVKHWISAASFLERLLVDRLCGLVALEAFFACESGEVTAEYIQHRLDSLISEDTARRRLMRMAEAGVVTMRKSGRTFFFRLRPDLADAALAFMRGEPILLPPQLAVNSK